MGILILTEAKVRAEEIVAYASQTENWYRMEVSTFVPGDRKEYVLRSGDHRAVFSWTMAPTGEVRRHMSVSVPRKGKYPQPIVVWTLAHYFGFTGAELGDGDVVHEPADGWVFAQDEDEGCIVVQQEVEDGPWVDIVT